MITLTEIQNDFAIKQGYKNITELMEESVKKGNTLQILLDLDKICIRVQQEQQKIIADNADTKMERYNDLQDVIVVDKSSIINENNIIRWKH